METFQSHTETEGATSQYLLEFALGSLKATDLCFRRLIDMFACQLVLCPVALLHLLDGSIWLSSQRTHLSENH